MSVNNIAKKGFTLIELLVVITIIAALAVVVFVALNPAKRLQDARDARRTTDVDSLLTAVHTYIVDNKGSYPTGLSAGMSEVSLGTAVASCQNTAGGCNALGATCLDLSTPLVKYLKTIPTDPKNGSAAATQYTVVVDANGIVSIKACGAEGGSNIIISR